MENGICDKEIILIKKIIFILKKEFFIIDFKYFLEKNLIIMKNCL